MRVVVVVVEGEGFEWSFSLGWDLSLLDQFSLLGGIRHYKTRFLFGVGSLILYHRNQKS